MRIWDIEGKKVAIWGVGKEGMSCLKLLRRLKLNVQVTVLNDTPLADQTIGELTDDFRVRVLTGVDAINALSDFDVVIKSPGISLYRPEVKALKDKGIAITSATRLWLAEHIGDKTVCITGSKGKSTTSSLVAHLLKYARLNVALGGNIGVPLLDMFDLSPVPDVWVIEISSYQTSDLDVDPTIGVILNLFPEHLDWHGDIATYFRDKLNLVAHHRQTIPILNRVDANIAHFQWKNPVYFNDPQALHVLDGHIYDRDKSLWAGERVPLCGQHNLSNVCAALTVVRTLGIELEKCIEAISSFKSLPHRLTLLGERDGIQYIDDSISTTPQSAMAAVNCYPNCPISILVGGFDRGLNWDELAEFLVNKPVHAIITMPDTGIKIASRASQLIKENPQGSPPMLYESDSLVEAASIASRITPKGGIVLLSPGAPSYGRFKNFEERGNAFARAAGFV